jgi:hypothetical protein
MGIFPAVLFVDTTSEKVVQAACEIEKNTKTRFLFSGPNLAMVNPISFFHGYLKRSIFKGDL